MVKKEEDEMVGVMVRLEEITHDNIKRFIIGKKDHAGKRLSLKTLTQYLFDLLVENKNIQKMLSEEIKMKTEELKKTTT